MFCKPLDISLVLKWSGLTKSVFLKQIHMSLEEWNAYESGERSVSLEHLISISHFLGVSIETLFTLEEGARTEKGKKSQHIWRSYGTLQGLQKRLYQERVETLGAYRPFLDKVSLALHPPIFGFCSHSEKLLLGGVLEFLGTDTLAVYEFLAHVKKPVYILPDTFCSEKYTGKMTLLPFHLAPSQQHLWEILGNLSQEDWEESEMLEESPCSLKGQESSAMGYLLFLPCKVYPILGDVVFYFLPIEERRSDVGSQREMKVGPIDYGEDLLHRADIIIHLGRGKLHKEEVPVIHRCFMARLDRPYPLGREASRRFGVCLLRNQEEESVFEETGEELLLKYFMPRFWSTLQDRQYDRSSVETWVRESFWNYRFVKDGAFHDPVEVAEMFSSVLSCYWGEILPSYLEGWREEERRCQKDFYRRGQGRDFFAFLGRSEEETEEIERVERESLSFLEEVQQLLMDIQWILQGNGNGVSSHGKMEPRERNLPEKRKAEGRDRGLPVHMDLSSLQKSVSHHGIFWNKLFLMLEKHQGKLSIFQEDYEYLQGVSHKKSKEGREAQDILGYLAECARRDLLRVSVATGGKEEMYRGAITSGKELVLVVDGTLKTSLQDLLPKEKRGKSPPLLTLQGYKQWLGTQ